MLSVLQYPSTLEPVYTNYIPLVVSSDITSSPNFRYIFDVYTQDQGTGDITFKVRINPYPRPDTLGIYSPHGVLKSVVSYNLQPFIIGASPAGKSITDYFINLGEEYNPGLTFADTYYSTGGRLGLLFSTDPGLLVGDVILIDVSNKTFNPQYDGTASVFSIDGTYSITVDINKGVDTTNEGGSITDLARVSDSSGTLTAFNASRQYEQKSFDFANTYAIGASPSSPFLTEWNSRVFYDNSWNTLSFYYNVALTPTLITDILFIANPLSATPSVISATYGLTTNIQRIDIATGYKNYETFNPAIANLIKTNDYDVYLVNWPDHSDYDTLTFLSQPFHYKYKEQCKEYEIIQVLFLNKLGAFDYFSFNLVHKVTSEVKRTTYRKVLGVSYQIGDRGDTVMDMEINEKMTLNSDWLDDDESNLLRTLVESPEVYIIQNDQTIPVIVEDNSYEVKTVLTDILFQFKLTISKANPIIPNI